MRHAMGESMRWHLPIAQQPILLWIINYENCLIDISLCLEADYPINLKPKLLIRKAKCFIKMGNFKKMLETIDDCCKQMQINTKLPKIDKDNYMKEMKSVMDIKQVDIHKLSWEETALPEVILEENRFNPSVSASIKLIHSKHTGTDFVAARDIPRGEVLFVDAAYSAGNILDKEGHAIGTFLCDYCWKDAKNCIPCKTCVNYSYCSEDCLDGAWIEYHQWECNMFQSKLLEGKLILPVRTLIKGAVSGEIFKITNDTKPWKSSKAINPYLQIYSLHLDLASFRSKSTTKFVRFCELAVIIVEYLKKTNFFTLLMSTTTCRKAFDTLVNFIGGLLIRHFIQTYPRCLTMQCASSIVSINKNQKEFEFIVAGRSLKFYAFCPMVSGVKYSCDSNTSMYFHESICIVKACRDIKAGNQILRSGFNLTPGLSAFGRQSILQELDIICDCTACMNINNNIDILNTYLCVECGRFAVLQVMQSPFMTCNNCKTITSVFAVHSRISFELDSAVLRERVLFGQYLEYTIVGQNALKKLMNPNHENLFWGYKTLLFLYSERDNLKEFKKALLDFKTCAKNRNGRFDPYEYMLDLTAIIKTCFIHLELNNAILQKQDIMDMLTYVLDVVNEAKEIAEFTFPPLLRLYAIVEFYIFEFRVDHVSLGD